MTQVKWSPYQQSYFRWVREGSGNAVVIAVAGAGKTTVLVEGARHMKGSVAAAMYNKKNATEFQARIAASTIENNQFRAGTFHSFGISAVRKAYPDTKVDEKAKAERLTFELQMDRGMVNEEFKGFVLRLISLAKQSAFGLLADPNDEHNWWKLVHHHNLEDDLEDPERAKEGLRLAYRGLNLSRCMSPELIDFDDMIYLPVVTNMRVWQNDWVLVDEAQDTNPARRAMARKMLRPGGRAVFVGDPAQAIYGFTGADNDSLDLIQREFGATRLPLTISYRCPKAVVHEAKAVVSHIEASPTAKEGTVWVCHEDDLFTSRHEGKTVPAEFPLGAQDAVICRKTAPLLKLAFRLIKDGVPCHVEGREIGAGLAQLANRWKTVETVTALRDRLTEYRERQVAKLMAKGNESAADSLSDRVETLLVLLEGCDDLDCLHRKLASMFADDAPTLTLSTVHKAKGREWDNVYILGRHQYMPSPWARQDWQLAQEHNLEYVAITRAKTNLVYVNVNPVD